MPLSATSRERERKSCMDRNRKSDYSHCSIIIIYLYSNFSEEISPLKTIVEAGIET